MSPKRLSHERPEFSRSVDIVELHEPIVRRIEADTHERKALAARLGVAAVHKLVARLTVQRIAGGPLIRVSGRFEGEVEQSCVVTLAPVHSTVSDAIDLEFGPADAASPPTHEAGEEAEPPEPLEGGKIDLGEVVTQFFSVGIDPYPRAPGAALAQSSFGPGSAQESSNSKAESDSPFAVLKSLRVPEK